MDYVAILDTQFEERLPAMLRLTAGSLLALLLGFGLMQMGNTLQGTLLSVRGGIESFSPAQIGAVGAGFWVGVVIGFAAMCKADPKRGSYSGVSGPWSDRLDRAAPAPAFNGSDSVDVARALTGFCFAGLFIVVESWLDSAATDETRGQIMSVYAMTGLLAGIAGQLLLPTTDPAGFRPFCIVAIIIAVALVPIALTRAAAPTHDGGGARISIRGALSAVAIRTRGRLPVRGDHERVLHPGSLRYAGQQITDEWWQSLVLRFVCFRPRARA